MKELEVKKDFTCIYTQKFPNDYLKEMKKLDYRIPDKTKPLYRLIAKKLYGNYSKIKVLDIGSSYGINSALMKYGLKMSELDDFFLNKKPTNEQSKKFFERLESDETIIFYQIDISQPALRFSENVNLCSKGICINLEDGNLDETSIPSPDMVIATGCIGYIGYKAFSNLFDYLKKQNSDLDSRGPVFAFSVLRMFDMEKIKETFERYGYSIEKSDIKPIPQRRFADANEKINTLSLLHQKGINTKWFEDDGYFYADFYIAIPKKQEFQLHQIYSALKIHAITP
jgi:hypothetical protein